MSLCIQERDVRKVLLAGSWYVVRPHSFDLDAYEFMNTDGMNFRGGDSPLVCSTGFTFVDALSGKVIRGPLTAIQAVEQEMETE